MVGWAGSAGASVPIENTNACADLYNSYAYFGLQRVNRCFCDNSYNNGYGNNGNQDNCPGGECPLTDCNADGAIDADGTADLCGNGQDNCDNRNAVYEINTGTPAPSPQITLGNTAQSSIGWGSTDGGRAVDGNAGDGSWGSASCTHTQNGDPEWWQVDLSSSYAIWDF